MRPKDLWEKAEEIVRERIARGGPCESKIHFENMVREKFDELSGDAQDEADFKAELHRDWRGGEA